MCKKTFLIASLFLLTIFNSNSGICQNPLTDDTSKDFLLTIEARDNRIYLTRQHGCAFIRIDYRFRLNRPQLINQNGMANNEKDMPAKNERHANFLISITKTEEGITLEGIIGTEWKTIKHPCMDTICKLQINSRGLVISNEKIK